MTRLIWSLGLPALLVAAMYAWGHDPTGKGDYHDWFVSQKQINGVGLCCGDLAGDKPEYGRDAHYVNVLLAGGEYYVQVDGRYILYPLPVDPYERNITGQNVAWYMVQPDGSITWYCLRLAEGT